MDGILSYMFWVWIGVMALSVFLEAATTALISIWFAAGALAALLMAMAGASLTTQLMVFVFISIAALAVARPLAKRFIDPHIVPTNADRLLGTECMVTERIDNERASGAVYADGKTWTARSADGEIVPVGEQVEIVGMEGVKLIIRLHAAEVVRK